MRHVAKVRIYPDSHQQTSLAKASGCVRRLWKNSLAENNRVYKETGFGLSRTALNARLPSLKKEYPWLAETYSQLYQACMLNLSRALINFFEGRARFPRFQSKHGKQSLQYPQNVKLGVHSLYFPKIGWVSARIHWTLEGKLKTVTVSQTKRGHYYASLLFDDGRPEPQASTQGKAVGVDLGVKEFAITSDGSKFPNPKHLPKHESNLKRKQKHLSRKKKGSNRRQKARQKLARAHEKVSNARQDFHHQLSRKLVNENQLIIAESLNVKGMLRNHNQL